MLGRVRTVAMEGVTPRPVEIEVDVSQGLPALNVVGLPDGAVREAKDRIRSALKNSGFPFPAKRVTVNLAPADLPKEGSAYDLPMALAMLVAIGTIPQRALDGCLVLGELALDGRCKPVSGSLPAALHVRATQLKEVIVPADNGQEAALAPGVRVVAPHDLNQLVSHIRGDTPLEPLPQTPLHGRGGGEGAGQEESGHVSRAGQGGRHALGAPPDMADIKGQESAKRALEIAAAGGHNLLMKGPPGSGKTMLARALPGILPPMSLDEALEVTAVHSVAGKLPDGRPLVGNRPFRAPHHTATRAALVGGGSGYALRPGEVSLAHRGVLFLDELPEFGRTVLEVLREPLEAHCITISRAARSTSFPARFQLISACNPCPCGYFGDSVHSCRCSKMEVKRYQGKLSGPLLDRIDLHLEVPAVPFEDLVRLEVGETSAQVRKRVTMARDIQLERNRGLLNAELDGQQLDDVAAMTESAKDLLVQASRKLGFSARAFHRIIRVARTLADLKGEEAVDRLQIAEGVQLREVRVV